MSNILAQQNFVSGFVRSAIASLKGRQTKEPVPEARLRLVLTEPQGRGAMGPALRAAGRGRTGVRATGTGTTILTAR